MELKDMLEEEKGEKTLVGVFQTNAMARGSENSVGLILLEASRFNHSCLPNLDHFWADPYQRVFATRDIKKGEEVFVTYGPDYWLGHA